MSRHAFLGTGQYGTKWLGEYESQWDDLRRSIVATVEMNIFGFSMVSLIYLFNCNHKIVLNMLINKIKRLDPTCAVTVGISITSCAKTG